MCVVSVYKCQVFEPTRKVSSFSSLICQRFFFFISLILLSQKLAVRVCMYVCVTLMERLESRARTGPPGIQQPPATSTHTRIHTHTYTYREREGELSYQTEQPN